MSLSQEMVLQALRQVQDPDLHQDIVTLGFVKDLSVTDGQVRLTIELTTPACPVKELLREQAEQAVRSLPGVRSVAVTMSAQVRGHASQRQGFAIPVKHIIPVASGKGGVGKSTVTVNLALALARTGAKVGIMDGDVYGPSVPTILGIEGEPSIDQHNRIQPLVKHGIQVVSMGFFMNPQDAVIWRGPMLHKTVQQFLGGVLWDDLDYLLVDLPPGTGDIQLSLCQTIPITGAVVVSTPQPVALNIAQKAIAMFNKLQAPVIGVVENMRSTIFGSGGAEAMAKQLNVPFLGAIPLDPSIREASDAGWSLFESAAGSEAAKAFAHIAGQLAVEVSIRTLRGCGSEPIKVTF